MTRKGLSPNDDRSGRPLTSQTDDSVEIVHQVLDKDQRISVLMIAEECGIPQKIVHCILMHDIQMRQVYAKMVPKVLTSKEEHLLKCQELHKSYETNP